MSLAAIGTGVATSVAGAVVSKGLNSLFGSEGDIEGAYGAQIDAMNAQMGMMNARGDQVWDWVQESWGELDDETKRILAKVEPAAAKTMALADGMQDVASWVSGAGKGLTAAGESALGMGEGAWERHEDLFQPLEEQWINEYQQKEAPGYEQTRMGEAGVNVRDAYGAQRENMLRRLSSYGMDDSQMRSLGMGRAVELAEFGEIAKQQTQAARDLDAEQEQRRAAILQYGTMYPELAERFQKLGMSGMEAGGRMGATAAQAGQTVADIYRSGAGIYGGMMDANRQTTALGADLMKTPLGYYGGGTTAGGAALQGVHGQQGTMGRERGRWDELAGAGMGFASNWRGLAEKGGGSVFGGGGGVQPGAASGTVQGLFADGGEVRGPGGPRDDAIPILASDGEYIVPAHVVAWKGREFFDKLINKSEQDQQALPA